MVAEDLYYKLLRIDLNVFFCTDLHVQLTYITTLKPGDVAIFFSNSGNTTEVLELARAARERNACIVAITKLGPNPLSELADYVLPTSSPELEFQQRCHEQPPVSAFCRGYTLYYTVQQELRHCIQAPVRELFTVQQAPSINWRAI